MFKGASAADSRSIGWVGSVAGRMYRLWRRRIWAVVRNLKDVEGIEMAFPAIGVFRIRNSCYKASRAMNSGVKVFLGELEASRDLRPLLV